MRTSSLPAPDSTLDRVQTAELAEEWTGDSSRRVMAVHARTSFNFATRFLPPEKRRSAIDLYAFFRCLDDLVDENVEGKSPDELREILEVWRAWTCDGSVTPPQPSLADGVERAFRIHGVPRAVFADFIEGLITDIEPRRIADTDELETYCYQVASTVGIAMAHVLGASSPSALAAASRLGAAMQRTNILRDMGEDLAVGRVYIPASVLSSYGLCVHDLRAVREGSVGLPERLRALMRAEIWATHARYERALPGIWLLPHDSRFPILLASRLYRQLLHIIERNGFDSINNRAATSRWDKAREFAICAALVRVPRQSESQDGNA